MSSLEDRELLSQYEVLHKEIATGAKCPKKEPKRQPKMAEHGPELYLNTNSMGRHRMLTIKQIKILAKDRPKFLFPGGIGSRRRIE